MVDTNGFLLIWTGLYELSSTCVQTVIVSATKRVGECTAGTQIKAGKPREDNRSKAFNNYVLKERIRKILSVCCGSRKKQLEMY